MHILRKTILSVFVSCFLISSVNAQLLNVERVRGATEEIGWRGDLGFDFSLSRYNDQVLKLANSANIAYNSAQHTYLFLTNLELVNVDGSSLISSGYVHLRSTLLRSKAVSPEGFVQYQYNNNLGLRNRALTGGGVRVRLLSYEHFSGHVQTGFMYEFEEWGLSGEESIEKGLMKSTSHISFIGEISPQTSLLVTGYYQARPDRFFKPRATFESQLNVRMSRHLSLSVSFTMVHDAEPVIDITKLTYELKNGLLISF